MAMILAMIYLAAITALFCLAVALIIAPLMIWKHTKETSRQVSDLIDVLKNYEARKK